MAHRRVAFQRNPPFRREPLNARLCTMLEIIRIGLHRVAMMLHDCNDMPQQHTIIIFRNTHAARIIFWHERYALTIWTSVASSCLGRMPAHN